MVPPFTIYAKCKGGKSQYVSGSLTLNLPVDNEYVVSWNQCSVVAIIINYN